jgi:hypothetical protein
MVTILPTVLMSSRYCWRSIDKSSESISISFARNSSSAVAMAFGNSDTAVAIGFVGQCVKV